MHPEEHNVKTISIKQIENIINVVQNAYSSDKYRQHNLGWKWKDTYG